MNDTEAGGFRQPAPGAGGVFGRRTGRKLRRQQALLLDDALPRVAIDLDRPLQPDALFPGRSELRLEIGFGGGEHLVAHARQRPSTGFIGCEPFRDGVVKLLEQAQSLELGNVRVYSGDAGLLIDRLPEACLAGVDLLYPDPWPKRRQRKRRFVSDETLERLARVMGAGATLRFATDIDDYAGWTLARVLRSAHFSWRPDTAEDWRRPWPDWPSTRYEAKALREGRPPVYLSFVRTAV